MATRLRGHFATFFGTVLLAAAAAWAQGIEGGGERRGFEPGDRVI